MAIRSNVSKREQWFVKNVSNRILTVGDLNKLPTFNPGDEYDLLNYHDKNEVGNSADLVTMSNLGWIRITKKKDNESVTYTSAENINDSIATAEEDETSGSGGGSGTAKVSSNDTTAGFLDGKLVAGANVTFTVGNDGANETLTIAAGAGASIAVEDNGSSVVTADTLNFSTGLDAADAGGGEATLTVNESEVDHDSLQNFVANEHVDHSAVSVTGGVGLGGGGTIDSNQSIDMNVGSLTNDTSVTFSDEFLLIYSIAEGHRRTPAQLPASIITSGTFDDARISESSVTQHESALTITESQISDLSHTTDTHVNVGNDGTTIVSDAARIDFDNKFAVTDGGSGEADLTVDEPNLTIWDIVVQGNQLISGGATWDSGLTFNVSDLVYVIDGVIYESTATQVTLDAADGSNDRIDVIVATTSQTVTDVTGTPNANPIKPDIDESTQVEVTFVTIPAGSSTPLISTVLVYDENAGTPTEWAASTSDPEFTLNSATDPFSGSVAIEATSAASNDRVTFTAASPVDITDTNLFEINIKSKAAWPSTKRLQIWFTLGGTKVTKTVTIRDNNNTFGFDSSNTSDYQNLSINKAFFNPSSDVVDGMVMRVRGGGAAIGFHVDRLRWQEGIPTATLQPNWLSIVGDVGATTADSSSDTLKILGDGGSDDAYIRTEIVDDTVSISLNRTLIENHIPMHLIGSIATNSDLYKSLMGYSFKYRFTNPGILTRVVARQGTVDSGGSQATVQVVIDSVNALSSALTLSGTADTDVEGTLDGNPVLANGDTIEIDVTQGTNGDAEDLAIDLVFTTNLVR